MGCCSSAPSTLTHIDGDGADFLERYTLEKKIGEGEFGVVKTVREKSSSSTGDFELACKILRKGRVFKDNVLYGAIDPKVLRCECEILSNLAGKHYTLHLRGLYESPSNIYIVTEYCSGGEMMQYVNKWYGDTGLRTDDISRIAFQLMDAVAHCADNNILHRDIKPENIMFVKGERGSDLRLIDFGSGAMDSSPLSKNDASTSGVKVNSNDPAKEETATEQADGTYLRKHATFAGTGFYISPEVFEKDYTCKTDVWSVGVTIYVLVAGYPVHALQQAFNILQSSKCIENRSKELQSLPNMPPDMPESFFQMLEMCLIHDQTERKNAKDVLNCSFLEGHRQQNHKSILIKSTKDRYAYFLEYEKYERSVTTLLASMLRKEQLQELLIGIENFIDSHHDVLLAKNATPEDYEAHANHKRLQIITIADLRKVLSELKFYEVISKMDGVPSEKSYAEYAYHIGLLRQFITYEDETTQSNSIKQNHSRKNPELDNSITRKWKKVLKVNSKFNDSTSNNNKLTGRANRPDDALDHSVQGLNYWEQQKKKKAENSKKLSGRGDPMSASTGGLRRNFSTPVLAGLSSHLS